MNYQNEIIELLDIFLEEIKEKRKKYEELELKKDLYTELFNLLDNDYDSILENTLSISILLNTIYGNDIYWKFYNKLIIRDKDERNRELSSFIKEINSDRTNVIGEYEKLKEELKDKKHMVTSANGIRFCFKRQLPMKYAKHDIYNFISIISTFVSEGRITSKEGLLYINDINYYNRKLTSEELKNEREGKYIQEQYDKIPNILNMGYEIYTPPILPNERKDTIDKYIKLILDMKQSIEVEELISNIKEYRKRDLTDDEYEYLIIGVINNVIEELNIYYQILVEDKSYSKMRERNNIVNDYYSELNLYLKLRDFYDEFCEEILNNISVIEVNTEEELPDVRRVIYACSPTNPNKARIISDLDDVPKEYYSDVYDLIKKFRQGTLSKGECKSLTNSDSKINSCMELKNDQVRIIFRHIKDDLYVILGVSVKKDDNDIKMYRNMSRRVFPRIESDADLELYLEFSRKTDELLEEIVRTKGRKGNR